MENSLDSLHSMIRYIETECRRFSNADTLRSLQASLEREKMLGKVLYLLQEGLHLRALSAIAETLTILEPGAPQILQLSSEKIHLSLNLVTWGTNPQSFSDSIDEFTTLVLSNVKQVRAFG